MNIKTQLAPKGLQFRYRDFVISDKYATILTVITFPKYIGVGYLSDLTSVPGVKIVIKHIPLPFGTITKMIDKEIAELKQEYETERDRTRQEMIRQNYESMDSFVTMLAQTQAHIYDFQMHIMITADTEDQLTARKMQLKNYMQSMQMYAIPLMFEQEKVLKSIIPIFPKQDIENRIGTPIPSPTIAAMYPFIFDSIKDPGLSMLLGTDFSGGVVLFNQFLYQIQKEHNRNNANMIILGTSGSGKSTAAKLLLRSHFRNNSKIVVIDPEGELEEMAHSLGGDFIDLGKGGEFGVVNPLEVVLDADTDELQKGMGYTVLTRTLQSIKAFFKYYDPTAEEDVITMLSEVMQETYKRFGMDFNTDFSKFASKDYPTFDDVYATIRGKILSMPEATQEKAIMEKLEIKVRPLVGELKFYFDQHSTISPRSNFIVFNIKEFMNSADNIRNALFFNILKYAWGMTLDSSVNTILMIDEAHVLMNKQNTLGADFMAQIQRRARKYNTGTIIITQQPSDFSDESVLTQGRAIFDNASYYLVMALKKQAIEDLSKLIDLNDNEKEAIKRYQQGDALFVCGSRRMQIQIIATQDELDSMGSGGGL